MGCYPLKEMITNALAKCNGKQKRRSSRRMVYSPPMSAYSHRAMATEVKSVNFSNHNPVIIIQPEPEPGLPVSGHYSEPAAAPPSQPGPSPSTEPEVPKPKPKGRKKTRFAQPIMQDNAQPGSVRSEPHHHGPVRQEAGPGYYGPAPRENQSHQGPVRNEPDPVYRGPTPYYAPSPLPRWEYGQRRQEYFSGEYCYYPTPIREGIYNIATDPHRLTTIFSEENPNACSIS